MTNFLRILLVVLTFRRAHQGPPVDERTPEQERNDTLDFLFGIFAAFVVAGWFGMYGPHEPVGGGPRAIGHRLEHIFTWILGFPLILIATGVLARVTLKRIPDLKTRFLIYGGFAAVSFFVHLHHTATRAEAAARAETARRESLVWKAREEEEVRAHSAKDLEMRTRLLESYPALSAAARVRWREDIEAAGANGKPGEIPPMLSVEQTDPGQLLVRNLASSPVCVRIAQVLRGSSPTAWQRCDSDFDQKCRDIGPNGSAKFALHRDDPSPACARGQLEFRVGTPLRPEPSWWSRSALDEFDDHPFAFGDKAGDFSTDQLRGEVAMLHSMIADQDRAARWRRELSHFDSRVEPD